MADLATLQTRLDAIEDKIDEAISRSSRGGRDLTRDLEVLERQRNRIERQIAALSGNNPSIRRGRYNPNYTS